MKFLPASLFVAQCLVLVAPLAVSAQQAPDSSASPKLTDAKIAAIVLAADDIDVQNGQLAVAKSKNKAVVDLGVDMVRDHTSVNDKAKALAAKLHLMPEENDFSRHLRVVAKGIIVRLSTETGADFDRFYVSNEVSYHQTVINAIDAQLIPAATNPELKALLEEVQPVLRAHLTHAMRIQARLKAAQHS